MNISRKCMPCATLALAFSLGGCGLGNSLLRDQAVTEFSTRYSCPESRLAIARVDTRARDVLMVSAPPSSMADDPERVAFRKKHAEEDIMVMYQEFTVVDVSGCAAHLTYFCWQQPGYPSNAGQYPYQCREVRLDKPDATFETFAIKPSARLSLPQQLQVAKKH